jgi:hypothetical protein
MTHTPEQDGEEPTEGSLLESESSGDTRALRRSGSRPVLPGVGEAPKRSDVPPASGNPVWVVVELPEEELGGAFATRLARTGFKSQIHHPAIFVRHAVVDAEPLAAMVEALLGRSVTGAKMTVLNGLGEPSLTDILTQLVPMDVFVERLKAQWLMPFIVSGGLSTLLQPIVTASGERWGYDALVRLPSRKQVLGEDIVRAARQLALAEVVDRIARMDAFATLGSGRGGAERLVVHVSGAGFAGLDALVRSLIELARAHAVDLGRVVVNAPWASCEDGATVGRAFHALRSLGVTLSVGGGPRAPEILGASDIASLVRELDASVVRVPAVTPDDALADVAQRLTRLGVLVHATHVGNAATAQAARERGAHLLSGQHPATAPR